jgi:hypothetical protein
MGSAQEMVAYDLKKDPYEKSDFFNLSSSSVSLAENLLQVHNQGYSRELNISPSSNLIIDDGWNNLRNDITGSIGFEFKLDEDQVITHLGMWDDHDRELPIRSARGIPTDQDSDHPSRSGKKPRTLKSKHSICLWEIQNSAPKKIIGVEIGPHNQGILEEEFRYILLEQSVNLPADTHFILTMSTTAGDGDHFHDDTSFDGLSPIINPSVTILKSIMFRNMNMNQPLQIPSFADLHPDYSAHRFPVGPTLKFK